MQRSTDRWLHAVGVQSMYHEAKGELTQAAELHRLLLEDDLQNLPAVKRQVGNLA